MKLCLFCCYDLKKEPGPFTRKADCDRCGGFRLCYEERAPARVPTGVVFLIIAVMLSAFIVLTATCNAEGAAGQRETLEAFTLRKAMALPVYYEDQPPGGMVGPTLEKRVELETVAREIARVSARAPLPPRQWAMLLLMTGWHESTYSIRIVMGSCRKHECDGGRARGAFQGHRLASMSAEVWAKMVGLENLPTQVEQADELLRRHLRTCPGASDAESIITGYMGKRCYSKDAQVAARLETYRGLLR